MRFGLSARILLAGAIVALFLAVAFALVGHSFQSVRSATRSEQRAEQTLLSATTLEALVVDLQTSTRGYALTGRRVFLAPWTAARKQLPAESRRLLALAPGAATDSIDAAWRGYVTQWSLPIVAQTARSPARGRAAIATGDGQRRVDRIRSLIDPFVARNLAAAADARRRVDAAEREGLVIGAAGIAITILLFAGIGGYFYRAAIRPVRRIAEATGMVASGDLDAHVPEAGAGEIGQLAVSFNEMARSLARQQSSLEEQNVDLERLANVLRAVLDSTFDGILLSDAEGNVQLANRPLVQMTRELGMVFEGGVVDRLLSVADRTTDPQAYRAMMERLRDNPEEATFNEFEDAVTGRVLRGWTSPVRDDRGAFVGRIWTMRDVTQQVELNRLKDEFVATVSHELRTPLTSMMGFLEMIREGEAGSLTDEQKRFLAIVYRSSERLQRLVGDLLFVARLDASGLQLEFTDVHIDEVMRDAVESASAVARGRGIEVVSDLAPAPPVLADRERISQLFANLLSNALKFTPDGGRVTARTFHENGVVVAEVEDNGIGIPEAEQERLFQRFFRSSTATAQAIPGTGLGLVISKAIVDAHGGEISVRSKPSEGTCFRIELPLRQEEVAA
jgi:signal transduction histidine kinase